MMMKTIRMMVMVMMGMGMTRECVGAWVRVGLLWTRWMRAEMLMDDKRR
jgi:hypothetical protein